MRLKIGGFVFCVLLLVSVSMLTSLDVVLASQWGQLFPERLPINYGYIRSNGEIEPPTLPIERLGDTYFLKEDIANYSITVEKSGIIVDGNGCMLSLPAYGTRSESGAVTGAPGLITIRNVSSVTIRNFVFQNCSSGISIYNSSEITVLQNTIVSHCGVYLSYSYNCDIEKNIINCTSSAMLLYHSDTLNIRFNKLTYLDNSHTGYGIIDRFHNCSIVGNVFSNFFIAMYHVGASNEIVGNTFENNWKAIDVHGGYENNEVHHNNFIDNGDSFSLDNGFNSLDDGKEGNYWSDYDGVDADRDGIGDTPYVISSIVITNDDTNTDNYPLMTPVDIEDIPEFPSWTILPLFLTLTIVVAVCKKKLTM